ncbi:hypothetical protein OG592_05230 [Streptomyces avidinii]|uniref:hypothetical protein n=1 Tax=Streptomyces avidinii TaxID=1895 RepID=UPI003868A80D|nr:hypothetical protein OG592_05230 [Streptomyces avidinii]
MLQVLRNTLGVAALVVGAVLTGSHAFPVAVPTVAGIAAAFLGVRLLGLLGTARDGLTLSDHGIGVGQPDNLMVIPWHEISALELTRHSGWTDLTVRQDGVRRPPIGFQHPAWVRNGGNGLTRIRTRRLSPLGGAPPLPDAVRLAAQRHRVRVSEV